MNFFRRFVFCSLAILSFVLLNSVTSFAQTESVRPGVNDSFANPQVSKFVERFEREGREVYDQREEIIRHCQLRPGMVVADVGSGTGLFTRLFAERVAKVYAVDIADNFLKHIDETCKKDGIKNVTTVKCSADSVSLEPNSVDLVFVCDTYHHFEYPYKTLQSIRQALKPDGVLVIVDFDRIEGKSSEWILGHVRASREVFSREIELSGFTEMDTYDEFFETSYMKRFKAENRISDSGHTVDALDEVKELISSGAAILLDVREQNEWDAGHLKSAMFIPLSKLKSVATQEEEVKKLFPNNKVIYCHCRSGRRVLSFAKIAAEHGIEIRPLDSGYADLLANGFEKAE